jgi:preprotein translocase subunit SecY
MTEEGRRIAFTIGALLVYRLGTHIPLPGIDLAVWASLFPSMQGGVLGTLSAVSGGAIQRLALFALGLAPYLTAAALLQVVLFFSRRFKAFAWHSVRGRSALVRYTRWLAIGLAAFQGAGVAASLEDVTSLVVEPGLLFRVTTMLTLTAGTVFLIWLCDQITLRGIGNGIALVLFAGIATELPATIGGVLELGRQGIFSPALILAFGLVAIAVTAAIVSVERARRHLPLAWSRPSGAGGPPGGVSSFSVKLNNAGLVPAVLASWLVGELTLDRPWLIAGFAILIVVLAFFYAAFVLDPDAAATDLKSFGGAVPGVEPGEPTAQYLDWVFSRITLIGALYLVLVCFVPELLTLLASLPLALGGTSFLIVVCTVLDINDQVRHAMFDRDREADSKPSGPLPVKV